MRREEASLQAIAHAMQGQRVGVVAENLIRARELMRIVDRMCGLLGIAAQTRPSRMRIDIPRTDSTIYFYSSQAPDQLRGPQFELAWVDDLEKWKRNDRQCPRCRGLRIERGQPGSPYYFTPCRCLDCEHSWHGGPEALDNLGNCIRSGRPPIISDRN